MNQPSDISINTNWQKCCELLLEKLNKTVFELSIAPLKPLRYSEHTLTLGCSPKRVFLEWIKSNYQSLIEAAFSSVIGEECKVVFEECQWAEPEEAIPAPASKPPVISIAPKVPAKNEALATLNSHFTFKTYIVGDCNQFAHSAALAVTAAPGTVYNPLFIHSNSGLGKSHLLNAIAWQILENRPTMRIECLTSEEFGNRFFTAMSKNEMPKFRDHFRNLDVLLIDDIQFFVGKERFQEELFHTFNALFNANKQIVMTSDRSPRDINGLEDRLVSRFQCGLTASIAQPDHDTRLAILRSKQDSQNIKFSDVVLERIASGIHSNVRRLEGALYNLVLSCSVFNIPCNSITVDYVEEHLKDFFSEEIIDTVTIDQIQKAVAEHYSIKLSDMTSHRRPANIAWARQVAMFLTRKLTGMSLPTIADCFRKTHPTVLHALKQIEDKYSRSEDVKRDIMQIERALRS